LEICDRCKDTKKYCITKAVVTVQGGDYDTGYSPSVREYSLCQDCNHELYMLFNPQLNKNEDYKK